jgi:NADH-quinone oxidoreductase subunit G
VNSGKTLAPYTNQGLMRIGEVPIYAVDGLVRRARALQHTPLAEPAGFRIHPRTAEQQQLDAPSAELRQNGQSVVLTVILDETIPENCVWIPTGIPGTEALGPQFGPVEIRAAQAAA